MIITRISKSRLPEVRNPGDSIDGAMANAEVFVLRIVAGHHEPGKPKRPFISVGAVAAYCIY